MDMLSIVMTAQADANAQKILYTVWSWPAACFRSDSL